MYLGSVAGDCQTKKGFTGKDDCDVIESVAIMALLAPKGTAFPADAKTFNEKIQEYINEGKLLPIAGVSDVATEGGDPNVAQVGSYGPSVVTNLNSFVRTLTVYGGDCKFKALKELDGQWDVFLLDRTLHLRGYAKQHNGEVAFFGHDADIFVSETGANAGTAYSISIRVGYGVNYDNQRKNRHTIMLDIQPEGITGVIVQKVSTGEIKVVSKCGGTDYTEMFANTTETSLFVTEDGSEITSITYNSESNTITVVPTEKAIKVADATALFAEDILGIGGINEFTVIS